MTNSEQAIRETKKYVLVVGNVDDSSIVLAKMKEQFGDDIIVVTPEQAKERGLQAEDFANIPKMKITAPVIGDMPFMGEYRSGRELRRERRKRERKTNER